MTDADYSGLKPYFLLLYGAFGVFYLCLAIWSRRTSSVGGKETRGGDRLLALLPVGAAILLLAKFALSLSHLLLAAAAVGTVLFIVNRAAWRRPQAILPVAAAIVLALSLAWWQIAPSAAALLPLAVFALILFGLAVGFSDPGRRRARPLAIQALFLIAGFLLLIDLGGYRQGDPLLYFLAHHWGAFIGSALHIKAGLVPFYDVPLQYGLGPTLAIAASCRGADCWASTEIIVLAMSLANALLILRMGLATRVPRGLPWQCVVAITLFAALFLWSAYPPDGNMLLAFPSVGGVRFLPTSLVACLLFFGYPAAAAVALVPALLWSPESAAMSLTVFGLCETARIGFLRAAWRSALLLAGSYAGLFLLLRALYGVWIEPSAFAEYVLHVPGPLPIDPFSDSLLLAAMLGLGAWLMIRVPGDPVTARHDRVAIALLFATASYWLGRSHPNNICNLAPFLVLVALRVLDRPKGTPSLVADAMVFGLATSVASLAFSPWRSLPYDPRWTVDIHAVGAQFRSLEPGIERVREQIANPHGLGIADFGPSYTRHQSETLVWTPMDPSSLWSFVPSARRQLYIQRASARLRRSGWAIFDDGQLFLFDDLQAGYVVVEQHSFDLAPASPGAAPIHFIAACFDPRPDIAPSIVGPACSPP
jgi:hypothetical protein